MRGATTEEQTTKEDTATHDKGRGVQESAAVQEEVAECKGVQWSTGSDNSVVEAVEIQVVGRLTEWLEEWWKIRVTEQVLSWIVFGLSASLVQRVDKDSHKYRLSKEETQWLQVEVGQLECHRVVELMGEGEQPAGIQFISPVFLVPKKGPKQYQLVIDMHAVNKGLATRKCKFNSLASVAWLAGKGWWMITFDLAQGYHHMMVKPKTRELLGFKVGQKWYWYTVMPFSLKWSPWVGCARRACDRGAHGASWPRWRAWST
jgi:hypothetical protein